MSVYNYGCVIDAGSSGSRIYIYKWPTNQTDTNDFIKVNHEPVFSNEMRPGVSSSSGIETLVELVTSAKDALPNVEPSNIPIYLGATAGLRLSDEADSIMANIRNALHKSGFMFNDDNARILTGNEESMYGWIVANYLNDSLGPSSTFGALDLGGGSTQISLSVPTTTTKEDEVYPLKIGNVHYPLYTQSYLSYGADQARIRYEVEFLQQSNVNPCYGTGYIDEDTGISGSSSNWDECFESVAKLFEQNSHLRGGKTDLSIISPPPTQEQQRYIAMSVFVFVWDFLGLQTGEETDDLNALKAKAKDICNLTYSQQTNQYDKHMEGKPDGRKTNKPFAQCFNAAYAYHLLSKGYELPVSKTPIQVHYEINGGKVEWSLGMMLVEANKLHSAKDESMPYSTHSYLFFTSILLALLILLSLYVRSRRVLLNPFRIGSSFQR